MFVPYLFCVVAIFSPFLEVHSMTHKENMWKEYENMRKLFDRHEERMKLFSQVLHTMEGLVKELEAHQAAIARSITAATVGGVVGTVLYFTPLAPVGMGIGIAGTSIVIGGVTAYGDLVGAYLVNSNIEQQIKDLKKASENQQESLQRSIIYLNILKPHMGDSGITSTIGTAAISYETFMENAENALVCVGAACRIVDAINLVVTDAIESSSKSLQPARELIPKIKGQIREEENIYRALKLDFEEMVKMKLLNMNSIDENVILQIQK